MATVAVIGLGAMGSRIAARLLDAGHELIVWNRSPEKAQALVERGATAAPTPADAARSAEVAITMLADPEALRQVTEGPDGLARAVDDETTVLEMSTVGPAAIERLAAALPAGTPLLDTPVLGSLSEAESGSLKIFVGGPRELFERWAPLLSELGEPMHAGPLGSGAAAKLVANLALLGTLTLVGEAVRLGDELGLEREKAFDVLAATPLAAQAERRREAIESREPPPPRFALSLARKDGDLIAAAAPDLRVVEAARSWLRDAEAAGLGDRDYAAVLRYILSR